MSDSRLPSRPPRPWRRWAAGVLIGAAAAALASGLVRVPLIGGAGGLVDRLEAATYDLRVAHTSAAVSPSSPIVIVDINDSSIRALAPIVGRWPWPRAVHASAIDYLAAAGARVIAYDVLFTEPEGPTESVINGHRVSGDDSDRALVDAVRKAGNVILLADATYAGLQAGAPAAPGPVPGTVYSPGAGFQAVPTLTLPFGDLANAALGVGHNVLIKDPGSAVARRMLPFVTNGQTAVPSLGVAAALAFARIPPADVALDDETLRIGEVRVPLVADPAPAPAGGRGTESSRQMLLRFPRPDPLRADPTYPTYGFYDVLLSEDQKTSGKAPAIPPAAFAGKLVFVGTSAAGLYDRYSTPFPGGAAGVELHATIADNILSRTFMRRSAFATDAVLSLVMGLGASLATLALPVVWAVAAVAALVAGFVWWATAEVAGGVWYGVVIPSGAAAAALLGGVAWQYVVEGREKRHIRRLFGRYVSKDVIEQLMADPSRAALGGERREMTVLFSDIRNFTTATERGRPEAVVAQLNEYFGAMVDVLFRHQGTLDKFVGDMVMGLFGAPLADPHHADHAVMAALDMMRELGRLNERWAREGLPPVDIGIGINSGDMIAGNIGSEAIMSYTVIGDAVNLGSRLESLNKQYGTHILMSDATRQRLTRPVDARPIGEVTVKGKTQPVMIFEVRLPDEAAMTRQA